VGQHRVDDAGAVEAADHGHASADGGGLEVSNFLHPADVELDVRALGSERFEVAFLTPGQEGAQVRFGVDSGLALEPGQVRRDRQPQRVERRRQQNGHEHLL